MGLGGYDEKMTKGQVSFNNLSHLPFAICKVITYMLTYRQTCNVQ